MFANDRSIPKIKRRDIKAMLAENARNTDDELSTDLILDHFSSYKQKETVFTAFNIFALLGIVIAAILVFA